jgi:hypothetical protein
MQCAPMPWLPPLQHDELGQQASLFTQHWGVSDARVPVAEVIANGETITPASRAMNASFLMMKFLLNI